MHRLIFSTGLLAVLAGCSEHKLEMSELTKPERCPEMAKLDRMVGTWSGTAEMVKPTRDEMQAMMPEGVELPDYYKGGGTTSWILDGRALKSEGWHEMPGGERMAYHEVIMWDPASKKYRSTYWSDFGGWGAGSMWFYKDGDSLKAKWTAVDAKGTKTSGSSMMNFVDNNTIEWTMEEGNLFYKMKLKGTSRRGS